MIKKHSFGTTLLVLRECFFGNHFFRHTDRERLYFRIPDRLYPGKDAAQRNPSEPSKGLPRVYSFIQLCFLICRYFSYPAWVKLVNLSDKCRLLLLPLCFKGCSPAGAVLGLAALFSALMRISSIAVTPCKPVNQFPHSFNMCFWQTVRLWLYYRNNRMSATLHTMYRNVEYLAVQLSLSDKFSISVTNS